MESWREQMYQNELYHHGIKGQKWGVRRYQNTDGTLTAEGRKRLYDDYKTTMETRNTGIGIAGVGLIKGSAATGAAAGAYGIQKQLNKLSMQRALKAGKSSYMAYNTSRTLALAQISGAITAGSLLIGGTLAAIGAIKMHKLNSYAKNNDYDLNKALDDEEKEKDKQWEELLKDTNVKIKRQGK